LEAKSANAATRRGEYQQAERDYTKHVYASALTRRREIQLKCRRIQEHLERGLEMCGLPTAAQYFTFEGKVNAVFGSSGVTNNL
jgi:hypothetical protein